MRVVGAVRLDADLNGTGYLLTASVAAAGGYAIAAMRYAPQIAQLARRIELTEVSLSGQGQAIDELSDALRSLLAAFDGSKSNPSQREAIAAAQWALTRR